MLSHNQKSTDFHGINVQPYLYRGAVIYPFEQQYALDRTGFDDGLCFGFTATLMHCLQQGDYESVQNYQNPIPDILIANAIKMTNIAIDQVRDGNEMEAIAFPDKRIDKIKTKIENISSQIDVDTNGAFLVYKQKNGDLHQLLFFNKRSEGKGKCVIQDPNRFTIDNLDIEDGKDLLTQIVNRSNPDSVLIVKDSYKMSKL